jgi:hypothetical protein
MGGASVHCRAHRGSFILRRLTISERLGAQLAVVSRRRSQPCQDDARRAAYRGFAPLPLQTVPDPNALAVGYGSVSLAQPLLEASLGTVAIHHGKPASYLVCAALALIEALVGRISGTCWGPSQGPRVHIHLQRQRPWL